MVYYARVEVKHWCRGQIARHWILYYGLRAFAIGGLIKLCIHLSDVLGGQTNLDGFVTAFFLCSYLHVVSFTKLLQIQDEICLSDSLMAIALLICTRLDSKETILRSIFSYSAAFVLICFKYSILPCEKEDQPPQPIQPPTVHRRVLESQNLAPSPSGSTTDQVDTITAEGIHELRQSGQPLTGTTEALDTNTLPAEHQTLNTENTDQGLIQSQPLSGAIEPADLNSNTGTQRVEPETHTAEGIHELRQTRPLTRTTEALNPNSQPAEHDALTIDGTDQELIQSQPQNSATEPPNTNSQPAEHQALTTEGTDQELIQSQPQSSLNTNTRTQPAECETQTTEGNQGLRSQDLTEPEARNTNTMTECAEPEKLAVRKSIDDIGTSELKAAKVDHQLNLSRVQSAKASIAASGETDLNAERLREKELAALEINPADVEIIMNELELDKNVVEKALREHKGDAVAATRELLSRYEEFL